MSEKPPIVYVSTVRRLDGAKFDAAYYGTILRVPFDDFTSEKHVEQEGQLLKTIEHDLIQSHAIRGGMYAEGQPIERIEVYDYKNGDVLIMYRVPYVSMIEEDSKGTA